MVIFRYFFWPFNRPSITWSITPSPNIDHFMAVQHSVALTNLALLWNGFHAGKYKAVAESWEEFSFNTSYRICSPREASSAKGQTINLSVLLKYVQCFFSSNFVQPFKEASKVFDRINHLYSFYFIVILNSLHINHYCTKTCSTWDKDTFQLSSQWPLHE